MKHAKLVTVGCLIIISLITASGMAQDDDTEAESDASAASYSRKGADTCLSCHGDDQVVLAIFRTPHGVPDNAHSPFGPRQLQCEACHGPGGNHAGRVRRGRERPAILSFLDNDPTDAATQNQMCLGCHTADAGVAWHNGAHAANDVSCASCHSAHNPKDAMAHPATQNETCFSCHAEQRTQSRKPYAHPLHNGKMSCSSCHNPHGTTAEAELQKADVNTTCYACHAEKRGPFLWEHAPVAEDCLSCHNPHGASQPGMLVRRAPLLCQSCHSQAGHPSVAQTPAGLPGGGVTPSPYLLGNSCMNCHSQVHGSNHPSGSKLSR